MVVGFVGTFWGPFGGAGRAFGLQGRWSDCGGFDSPAPGGAGLSYKKKEFEKGVTKKAANFFAIIVFLRKLDSEFD